MHSLPHISIPSRGITVDEPTILYIRVSLDGVQSMDFDKCVMTLAYHYSIIQNSFTVLKDLRAPPIQNPLLIYVRCYWGDFQEKDFYDFKLVGYKISVPSFY